MGVHLSRDPATWPHRARNPAHNPAPAAPITKSRKPPAKPTDASRSQNRKRFYTVWIFAICLPFIPDAARIVRSSALSIREMPYVDAARALGFSHTRIIMRHMVPNVMAPYLIILTANIGQAILLEASLSYLGLGVQEPTPAWGLMLQGGAEEYAESAFWVAFFPGAAITLAVFGFNLFGDGLRDALDPRLRRE